MNCKITEFIHRTWFRNRVIQNYRNTTTRKNTHCLLKKVLFFSLHTNGNWHKSISYDKDNHTLTSAVAIEEWSEIENIYFITAQNIKQILRNKRNIHFVILTEWFFERTLSLDNRPLKLYFSYSGVSSVWKLIFFMKWINSWWCPAEVNILFT